MPGEAYDARPLPVRIRFQVLRIRGLPRFRDPFHRWSEPLAARVVRWNASATYRSNCGANGWAFPSAIHEPARDEVQRLFSLYRIASAGCLPASPVPRGFWGSAQGMDDTLLNE